MKNALGNMHSTPIDSLLAFASGSTTAMYQAQNPSSINPLVSQVLIPLVGAVLVPFLKDLSIIALKAIAARLKNKKT